MTINLKAHTQSLLDNYERCFSQALIAHGADAPARLMAAPFVVLSHGNEADPIFNYANRTAQTLFEMDWAQFTALPSRFSAQSMHRDERQKLLDEVQTQGYSDNYKGIRISATGKRFYIHQARIWNLLDPEGERIGQAATFSNWEWL
ncbi:MAG: MEKHLA domain-containing protein [Verrucomicrobiota bacterium]